ncbi:hypothetical protein CCACVL1_30798 [Corchorus capsularis]|uniref:Uncharacterized protein n=1 Tax=Corchorus capsularis TaxID=210143 RepID=A0A1R3FVL8_COCAP|nr:hypothetical protein CCACVL1_30798 [Corchorus capsularis]
MEEGENQEVNMGTMLQIIMQQIGTLSTRMDMLANAQQTREVQNQQRANQAQLLPPREVARRDPMESEGSSSSSKTHINLLSEEKGDFCLDSSGNGDDDEAAINDGDELASLSLVASRTLRAYVKGDVQRENLFHTRMYANGKPSSVVIDGESFTNIVSDYLVKELQLPTSRHPKPYSLGWLNDREEIRVNKQVLVTLSLGRYKEDVLCDVLPMRACHVLLGKPWQYDNKVKHDGETNKYSFKCGKVPITLVPLSLQKALKDKIKLRDDFAKLDAEFRAKEKSKSEPKIDDCFDDKTALVVKIVLGEKKEISKEVLKECMLATKSEIKNALHDESILILLLFRNTLMATNNLTGDIPSKIVFLLSDFVGIGVVLMQGGKSAAYFYEKIPSGLPSIRRIELHPNVVQNQFIESFPYVVRYKQDLKTNLLQGGGNDPPKAYHGGNDAPRTYHGLEDSNGEHGKDVQGLQGSMKMREDHGDIDDHVPSTKRMPFHPLKMPLGSMTRARAKKFKDALMGLV